jgi:serine protease Do
MKKFIILTLSIINLFSCKTKESSTLYKEATPIASGSFKAQGCIEPDTFIKLVDKVGPAVVNINTSKTVKMKDLGPFGFFGIRPPDNSPDDNFMNKLFKSPKEDRVLKQNSLGSGFIISKDGYIITNNHVVEQADEIDVTLADNQEDFRAKVIGKDPKTDIALIKIEPKRDLTIIEFGDSDTLKVGEVVVAIGNPFGLSHTVTQGIVSAKERSIGVGNYESFIQTDASINRGNSGGPLLNIDGLVVGINTAIIEGGQGIGFSIPINMAKNVVIQLKDTGKVSRAWIGVYVQKVTEELAKSFKLSSRNGALVSRVIKDSPAEKAGLKNGDVIISFDGKEIKDYNHLPLVVASTPIGKKCEMIVIREGNSKSFTIKLEELKEEAQIESAQSSKNPMGITVENITQDKKRDLGLEEDTDGVVVSEIDPEGPAAQTQLQPGDVIMELNSKGIRNVNDFNRIISRLKKGDDLRLYVKRGKEGSLWIAFTL